MNAHTHTHTHTHTAGWYAGRRHPEGAAALMRSIGENVRRLVSSSSYDMDVSSSSYDMHVSSLFTDLFHRGEW